MEEMADINIKFHKLKILLQDNQWKMSELDFIFHQVSVAQTVQIQQRTVLWMLYGNMRICMCANTEKYIVELIFTQVNFTNNYKETVTHWIKVK